MDVTVTYLESKLRFSYIQPTLLFHNTVMLFRKKYIKEDINNP